MLGIVFLFSACQKADVPAEDNDLLAPAGWVLADSKAELADRVTSVVNEELAIEQVNWETVQGRSVAIVSYETESGVTSQVLMVRSADNQGMDVALNGTASCENDGSCTTTCVLGTRQVGSWTVYGCGCVAGDEITPGGGCTVKYEVQPH